MGSPIENYIAWFQSLPSSHQEDIAAFAGHTIAGFNEIDLLVETLPGKFVEAIRRLGSDPHKGVGIVLSLRANFDFFFARSRATAEDWEVTRQKIEGSKQWAIDNGKESMIGTADRMLDVWPANRDAWIAICATWKTLCDGDLSDGALEQYFHMARPQ